MHTPFDHKEIEAKWQQKWDESGIYNIEKRDESKEKEYVLVELPYPSGNLHIGHWFAFAVTDIYVRAHKMQGKQVFFPMGFDAFGLPAENAAIKHGLDPKQWTEENIENMTTQLRSMGNAFTWNAMHQTNDPEYYKWTQWMFIKFFENGIAYRGTGIVNWCPSCNTVLANEQVVNDHCERCDTEVEKKEMEEWKLRITDYADRLVDDLEALDWPEHIKESQRKWIGRNQGSQLDFEVNIQKAEGKNATQKLEVFTTRPDTLFGATFMVLAPEHDLIQQNKEYIDNWDEVAEYIQKTKKKAEQDRLDETKEKTGVKIEGVTATNPGNGEEIPVYIADYVLAGYGTGAIMAVPAHDERDGAFAEKFGIPITQVIVPDEQTETNAPYTGEGTLVNSGAFNGMDSEEAKQAITEKVGGMFKNTYRLRDWSVGRQRYWGAPVPIVYDPEGTPHPIPKEHLPWLLPTDVDFRPTGEPPLAKSQELVERTEKLFGEGWKPEVVTFDTFIDSSWYFLRYLDPHNEQTFADMEKQKDWMPIDVYFGGAEHTTMHLLYSRFWQKALYDLGLVNVNEPYNRRINRGLVLGPDGNKMSKSKGNVIDPGEQVDRLGADTVKMYLAFMGPYGESANYPWDMGGIVGIRRFLERVYGLKEHITDTEPEQIARELHKTIKKVGEDIERYKFNTAVSAMMIFVNAAEKEGLTEETYGIFLRLIAPFAPHLAEELWHNVGGTDSVHLEEWPAFDAERAKDDVITIGVQINGKLRGSIDISPDADEDTAMKLVHNDASLTDRLDGTVTKVIYIPGKILNIITS